MSKKKVHMYWTTQVDYGISKYLSSNNQTERDKIYNQFLKEPFEKMSEIMSRRWNWNYIPTEINDLKHELVSHMMSKIHNYNPSKGKSFGYFSLIVKNYLIQMNDKMYKYTIKHSSSDGASENVVLGGHRVHKGSWQNVVEIINKKDDFHHYIDFLDRYGQTILGQPHNEIINPLLEYVRDIDNTKHQSRGDFVRYIKKETTLNNHLLFQTTHILKNIYRKFTSKISSPKEMKRWIKCLIWKQPDTESK
jgi:hypothetical protein